MTTRDTTAAPVATTGRGAPDGQAADETTAAGETPAAEALAVETLLDDLEAGRIRAAEPDATTPGGWRVRADVKAAILDRFRDQTAATWEAGPLTFRDRAAVPPRDLRDGPWRVVPGGTAVRRGAYLGPDVVVMPPSYINIGAWVGEAAMVDSHVLVGSCAQIGARVHLAAGVTIGGVLEPPGARPVIVEDDAFVGAGSALLDGVLIGRGAVVGAGVTLTGTSRLYDLVRGAVLIGTPDAPLAVPPGAVIVPGARTISGEFAERHRLSIAVAVLVKDRDPGTSARVALESTLR
ncbi:MAG: 2,3,4,5-tetrahydropyridine-2,6-dicarboxylate N-succinyltransferase [Chloroflexota bacterium]|nr:2,3,4,5-tetrahydropyridine-2,6-dicarboxylate N-succinyltransferase [Chloroflexota bacterium]